MAMIYEPREIAVDGKPTGKWRMTSASDEGGPVFGMCEHEHGSSEEARSCPDVAAQMESLFPKFPRMVPVPEIMALIDSMLTELGSEMDQARFPRDEEALNAQIETLTTLRATIEERFAT